MMVNQTQSIPTLCYHWRAASECELPHRCAWSTLMSQKDECLVSVPAGVALCKPCAVRYALDSQEEPSDQEQRFESGDDEDTLLDTTNPHYPDE